MQRSPQKSIRDVVARRRPAAACALDTSDFVVPPPFNPGESCYDEKSHLSSIDIVKRRRNASRCLFPKQAGDEEDTDRWLTELEEKHVAEASKKWQFDFVSGRPLKNGDEETRCQWDVAFPSEVPRFYGEYQACDGELPSTSSANPSAHAFSQSQGSGRRRSPEKRRRSVSPRKPVGAGVITRMAAHALLPPSAAVLLSAPRKTSPSRWNVSVSPRKASRVDFRPAAAANGHSSRQLTESVYNENNANHHSHHVYVQHRLHDRTPDDDGDTNGLGENRDVTASPLARKSNGPKTPKEHHKTPHKTRH